MGMFSNWAKLQKKLKEAKSNKRKRGTINDAMKEIHENILLWDSKKTGSACPQHKSLRFSILYEEFEFGMPSMPPEPKMGLGEEVKMSGQWRVAAVPFAWFWVMR